jgi:hypothetical protein
LTQLYGVLPAGLPLLPLLLPLPLLPPLLLFAEEVSRGAGIEDLIACMIEFW